VKQLVMVVEDQERDGQLMKHWVETFIQDVNVSWLRSPREAKVALEKFEQKRLARCIVLDMYYPDIGNSEDASFGVQILDEYPDIPIILISARPETRDLLKARASYRDHMPLLQLDKPHNLFPAGDPLGQRSVDEFSRDLIEAVKCGLLVGSLQEQIAHKGQMGQLGEGQSWGSTGRAAVIFCLFVLFYAVSILYFNQFLQHLSLALCAVTGVHLFDRALLLNDFRRASEEMRKSLADLSVSMDRSTHDLSARLTALSGEGLQRSQELSAMPKGPNEEDKAV